MTPGHDGGHDQVAHRVDSAITVSASICSVIRMMPISAVRAEPASPVTNTAQSTGPSSRMRESATAGPEEGLRPEARQGQEDLQARAPCR